METPEVKPLDESIIRLMQVTADMATKKELNRILTILLKYDIQLTQSQIKELAGSPDTN